MSSRLAPIGKRISASTQRYTFTFQPNSAEYNAQEVEAKGKILDISAPSGTKVFKAISSSPFQQQVGTGDSVAEGDILQVELDATPTAKETVEVVVGYADIQESKTLPEDLGGNANFLYVLNHQDGTVSCVDLVNSNVIDTINMPSDYGNDKRVSVKYRHIDRTVFIFYNRNGNFKRVTHYIQIDADPSNSTFNTVINAVSYNSVFDGLNIMYDQINDFFVGLDAENENEIVIFDENSVIKRGQQFETAGASLNFYHSYILGLGFQGANVVTIGKDTVVTKFNTEHTPAAAGSVYNYINGLVYTAEDDTVSVKETFSFSLIASIQIGENRGDVEYDPVNDIIIAATAARNFITNNSINKIDPSTNTLIGQEVVSSNEAINQLIYSRATGLMYAAKSNTDQLLVIDPSNTVGNLIVNRIKIGKLLDEPLNNTSWMALNQIVL